MPEEEGVALVAKLREHATQPKFVYHHKWRAGDLIMWDNYCTLHRATYLDIETQRQRLHRTTINGTTPTGIALGPTTGETVSAY
jgi:taurine dioxygenase